MTEVEADLEKHIHSATETAKQEVGFAALKFRFI